MNIGDHDGDQLAGERAAEFQKVMELFDYVVESSKVGVRKPDPRFYEMACEIVKVEPQQVVFLDDLGVNLKPARAMGMATIKVTDHREAIEELEAVLGMELSR
jgi:putative hydrolase of the HAD superfamily